MSARAFENEEDEECFCDLVNKLQNDLIQFLEQLLQTKNRKGIYVSMNVSAHYGMSLDIISDYLTCDHLFDLILFLGKNAPKFVLAVGVYRNSLKGANYLGRIFVGSNIVHLEKCLGKDPQVAMELLEFESKIVKK